MFLILRCIHRGALIGSLCLVIGNQCTADAGVWMKLPGTGLGVRDWGGTCDMSIVFRKYMVMHYYFNHYVLHVTALHVVCRI